jgi:hypothetical protein
MGGSSFIEYKRQKVHEGREIYKPIQQSKMKAQIKKAKCWLRGHEYFPFHNAANGTSYFVCPKCRDHARVKDNELPNLTPGYVIILIFVFSIVLASFSIFKVWQSV